MATIQEVLDQVAALPTASKPYINPYAGHRSLTEHEQELLGEYARLADTVRRVSCLWAPAFCTDYSWLSLTRSFCFLAISSFALCCLQ